jgi:hypothetical protein
LLKTKLHNILININYRSERQSHIYYWQYFEHMLKQAHNENNNIICLGDMNKNFLGNLPHNVNDILVDYRIEFGNVHRFSHKPRGKRPSE